MTLLIISYGGHFVFQNEVKIFCRHVFTAIDIAYKFGKDILFNKCDIKFYVKMCTMDTQAEFYNIPTTLLLATEYKYTKCH